MAAKCPARGVLFCPQITGNRYQEPLTVKVKPTRLTAPSVLLPARLLAIRQRTTRTPDTATLDLPPKRSAASEDRVSLTYMRRGLGEMNMKRGFVLCMCAAAALACSAH